MIALVTVCVVVVATGLPAVACADSPWLAGGLSPLLFALFATVGGMIATFLTVSVLPVMVVIAVLADVAALWSLRRRDWSTWFRTGPVSGAVVTAAGAIGLLGLKASLLNWDTRTHWFGPARWFFGGGSYVAHTLVNPAFAHRDYPPLIAASVGSLWSLQGHVDLRSGQILVTLLNVGAVVVMGLGIPRLFPRLGPLPAVGGAALTLAAFGYTGQHTIDGYADLVWAACVTIAVLRLLLAPSRRPDFVVGAVAIAVAGLTKNEGTLVALAVGSAACWRHRRALRDLPELWAAMSLILVWPLYVRVRGVPTDLQGRYLREFLNANRHIWRRAGPTAHAMNHQLGGLLVVAGLCTFLGLIVAASTRRSSGIASTWWSWGTIAFGWVAIWATYVISAWNLAPWLATSVARVTISLRLLMLTETILWAMCGLELLRRPGPESPSDPPAIERPPDPSMATTSAW